MNKILPAIILLLMTSTVAAQILVEPRPSEVDKAQAAVNEVIVKAGMFFKEGLIFFEDRKLSDAGDKFNKSIETFLYSTLNTQSQSKLQNCYNQLIETVYRIEFPTANQPPQIKDLALTCTWTNIDAAYADKIAALVQKPFGVKVPTAAFNTQQFEPSPLDDLSKFELSTDDDLGSRVVKARAGDTVRNVAERYGADAVQVADYNGLLPNSVLGAGREIKIPGVARKELQVPINSIYKRSSATCNLTRGPVLRGFRFGLTPAQVGKTIGKPFHSSTQASYTVVDGSLHKVDIGEALALYSIPDGTKNPQLDGLDSVIVHFFQNATYKLAIGYKSPTFKWKGVEEFSVIVSEKLGLPKNAWGFYGNTAIMTCKGFWIGAVLQADGSSMLSLENTTVKKLIETRAKREVLKQQQRKRDAELNKKRDFRP